MTGKGITEIDKGISARKQDINYWEEKIKQLHDDIHLKEEVVDLYETKIEEAKKAIEYLLNNFK